ncbi:PHP domain-containing protein [Aquibacillus kalidii]|uniref:PHP domain-containing protein n=1 Tax=Aquibacillus kalidii TaxID=2762597 RepID=UPI0016467614|nr:PHP domain-containing protein [Aquibacillus kalidii]
MFIDFHTHTKLSKKVDFSLAYFKKMIRSARRNGLTALALTEHFNTTKFEDIFDTLDQHFHYNGHYYDVDGFKVFTGMEIDIRETGHNLIIGHRDDIRTIRARFANNTKKSTFPTFDQLFNVVEGFDVIKIGAHPTRESTPLLHLGNEKLQRYDAFDLNGKDVAKQPGTEEKLKELGVSLNKPVVAGSDSHLPVQFGCVKNKFYTDCETIEQLREAMVNRQYDLVVSDHAALKVNTARFVKRTIKMVRHV